MSKKYILLSTYDPQGSKNLGDHLLTVSAEKLIKSACPDAEITTYYREENLTEKLDELNAADAIILPGFAIRNQTYPRTYRLVDDLNQLKTPIIPLGCGTKFDMLAKTRRIDDASLAFIKRLEQNGPIPCRELITRKVLKDYGIKVGVSGDLGMFDPDFIGQEVKRPSPAEIKKVVFTTPHNPDYLEQSKQIIDMIAELFPQADKYVSFQSTFAHGNHPQEVGIAEHGKAKGFIILQPELEYGDNDPLNVYADTDLHIGYRCHGHLYFLRTRKPSVLLSEDSRGVGFSQILGLPVFSAFNAKASRGGKWQRRAVKVLNKLNLVKPIGANPNLAAEVKLFLEEELQTRFLRYVGLGQRLDTLYQNGMHTFLKQLP